MIATRKRQVKRHVDTVVMSGAPRGQLVTGSGYAGFTLPGVPESVAVARSLTRQALSRAGEQAENAVTCVSELVTNAILHSRTGRPGGRLAVTLEMLPDWSVVLSVLDEGARTGRGLARLADESGRGLSIVEVLSDDWGVIPMYGSGRLTWCRLRDVRHLSRDVRHDASRDASHDGRDVRHDAGREGGWSPFARAGR